jgi:hypothetical protein
VADTTRIINIDDPAIGDPDWIRHLDGTAALATANTETFHGSHDQSTHGNWARGGSMDDALAPIAEPDGGFTLSTSDLTPMTTGFAVAIGGSDRLLLADGAFDQGRVSNRLRDLVVDRLNTAASMSMPDGTRPAIGGWHNPADGKLEVNVTVVFPNTERAAAEQFAADNDQIAMADLDAIARQDWANAIISTGGTGGVRDTDDDALAASGTRHRFRVASTATVSRHE